MTPTHDGLAIVAGVGDGLGRALVEEFHECGYIVAALARNSRVSDRLAAGRERIISVSCDLTDAAAVHAVFERLAGQYGPVKVLAQTAAEISIGPFLDTDPSIFDRLWRTNVLSAALACRAAIPRMLEKGGTIILVGATASIRGGGQFSAFASSKFALRGLAQSLAREFGPRGVHIVHLLIDGLIWSEKTRARFTQREDACLRPESIANVCRLMIEQDRSAWSHEIDLRPAGETF